MFSFRPASVGLLITLTLLLGSCRPNGTPRYVSRGPVEVKETYQGSYPIRVVCTTGMVADLVRNVGGRYVEVVQLMGPDVDPHLYKASPGDVQQLSRADLIFYNGLHLEGKLADVLESLSRRRPAFAVAEYSPPEEVLSAEGAGTDPHVWFDVNLWNAARGVVQEVLTRYDPANADDYRAAGDNYRQELDHLHAWAREQLATVPKGRRVLVTAHDAFRYFGKAYDVEVNGIQGISTESEASVRHVNELVDYIVANGVKAVFVETSVNERNMRSLVDGCRARGHEVKVGPPLFSDAMGPPGTAEGTYTGMVRHNVLAIVNELR